MNVFYCILLKSYFTEKHNLSEALFDGGLSMIVSWMLDLTGILFVCVYLHTSPLFFQGEFEKNEETILEIIFNSFFLQIEKSKEWKQLANVAVS